MKLMMVFKALIKEINLTSIAKNAVCYSLISVMVIWLSIYRINKFDENTVYRNFDATYHVLLTIQAFDETPVSVHKWMPIYTLGDALSKNTPWAGGPSDRFGNYYYFSFPAFGFLAPYAFLKLFDAELTFQNLAKFNFFVGWLATILIFFLIKKLSVRCFSEKSYIPAGLAAIAYATAAESLYSHGYIYWGQSISQLFFICFLINLYDAIALKTNRSFWLMALFGFLMAFTEWTGYVCLMVSMLYFLPKALRFDKYSVKVFCILGIAGILAGALFIAHMLSFVSLKWMTYYLRGHFYARSFNHVVPLSDLLLGYYWSFGRYILVLIPIAAIIFIFNRLTTFSTHLFSANKSGNTLIVSPYFVLLSIAFLVVVAENLFMKEHAISYTYDRLKLIIPILMLIPYLWSTGQDLHFVEIKTIATIFSFIVKTIIAGLIFYSAFLTIKEYPGNTEFSYRGRKNSGIIDNQLFVKNIDLKESILGDVEIPAPYFAVLFHKNLHNFIGKSANMIMEIAKDKNAAQAAVINAEGVARSIRRIKSVDIYDLNKKVMTKYMQTQCDNKSKFIKKENELFQCEYDLRDLQEGTAYNLTNDEWNKGIAVHNSGFLVMGYLYLYLKGDQVTFSNQEKRTVTDVIIDPPFLQVFVDGPPLNADEVGWPNKISKAPR